MSLAGPSLSGLADAVLADPTLDEAIADARGGMVRALDLTGPAALRPFVVDGLVRAGRTVLAVTATVREAEDLVEELGSLLDPDTVALLPELGDAARTSGSARAATPSAAGSRCCAGCATPAPTPPTARSRWSSPRSARCCSRRSRGSATSSRSSWCPARPRRLEDVVQRLADAAYSRVDLVERRGEFAVRGGIVDVFPPTEEHPLRVEFWGDDVEEIRSFSVADQRTLETVDRLWAPPCRELLLTDEVRRRALPSSASSTPSWSSSPTRSPPASPSRAWSRWRRRWSTRWSCWSTCCPPTPTCWSSTPSGSAAAPTTWSRPARSSSARAGRPRPAAARRRSTSAPRRTAPSATSARTRSRPARPGGRSARSGWPTTPRHCCRARRHRHVGRPDAHAADAGRRRLPRRRRPRVRRPRAVARRGLPHGRRAPRPRPGPAHRRGARRARRRRPAGRRARRRARRPTWSR